MNMNNNIQIFDNPEFGKIRTMECFGVPYFFGKDVALVLGYSNPQKAIRDHVDEEDKTVNESFTVNGTTPVLVNESGLYSLILSSKMPKARQFKHWITSEVLPAIRKHGAYMTEDTAERVLNDPDFIIRLATNFKQERQRRMQAEGQVAQLSAQVSDLKPKADYCDVILASKSAVTITQIAADYNMSAKAMNNKLHELGIQWKVNDQWILYADYMSKGYTRSSTFNFKKSDGEERTKISTLWTQKGRLFLYNVLKANGILPLMEQQNAV